MNTTIFFCQRLDPKQDINRRILEKELGPKIKFFPLPCSGRLDALHLLRALEAGAGKVFVVACPQGACRYGQGNMRARKRIEYAQGLIEEIGLATNTIELVIASPEATSVDQIARTLLGLKEPVGSNQAGLEKKIGNPATKQ